jgi:Ca2+-transporting ATPase
LPAQLLWINLVADGVFDKTLALERAEPGLMRRPPRPPGAAILSAPALGRIALLGGWMALGTLASFRWELLQGASEVHARTTAFLTLAAFQWGSAFAYRSNRAPLWRLGANRWMLGALALALALQLLATYWPPLSRALGTEPISGAEFLGALGIAASLLVFDQLAKLVLGLRRGVPRAPGVAERTERP